MLQRQALTTSNLSKVEVSKSGLHPSVVSSEMSRERAQGGCYPSPFLWKKYIEDIFTQWHKDMNFIFEW